MGINGGFSFIGIPFYTPLARPVPARSFGPCRNGGMSTQSLPGDTHLGVFLGFFPLLEMEGGLETHPVLRSRWKNETKSWKIPFFPKVSPCDFSGGFGSSWIPMGRDLGEGFGIWDLGLFFLFSHHKATLRPHQLHLTQPGLPKYPNFNKKIGFFSNAWPSWDWSPPNWKLEISRELEMEPGDF